MVLAEDLRQAVLQAAIQGKLTERISADTAIQNTLLEIEDKRKHLDIDRKLLFSKEIDLEKVPFGLPKTWTWIRLGSICEVITKGSSPKWQGINYTENGLLFVTSENVGVEKLLLSERKYVDEKFDEISPRSSLKYGDLLTNIVGASIGRTAFYDLEEKANINQAVCIIRLVNTELAPYVMKYMNSNTAYKIMMEDKVETARPNISLTNISDFLIPFPPIEEQQRIVDKINEIMPKIDEYEKIEKELEALKKEFPMNMKDALLQAAMQGKLTEQLESDSGVDELLALIRKEKEELIAQKKIKKEELLPDIEEEGIPFDIPDTWRWVKLNEIGEIVGGGTPKTTQTEFWNNGEISWITPADMSGCGRYIKYGEKSITQLGLDNSSAKLFPKGSVIISSRAPIGYIAIAENEASTSQGCKTFSAYLQDLILSEFIYYAMQFRVPDMEKRATGTTFKEISGKGVGQTMIPLPPIEEQHRIVERLDSLLPLCEDLKEIK